MIIDERLAGKMAAEDPWLMTESGALLVTLMKMLDTHIPSNTELGIEMGELATVKYDGSPLLHCFLSNLYQDHPNELGEEFKLHIEKQKLSKTGKEHLLDFWQKPVAEITASLPHKGQDLGENIGAANDYSASHIILSYLSFNNTARVYHHMEKSLQLSGKNPVGFKEFIEPAALLYMTPFLYGAHEEAQESGFSPTVPVLIGFLNDKYKAAKRRIDSNV